MSFSTGMGNPNHIDGGRCSFEGCKSEAYHECAGKCGRWYCDGHEDLLTPPEYLCVGCENDKVRAVVAHGLTAADFAQKVTT